jgi:hypothetical protein
MNKAFKNPINLVADGLLTYHPAAVAWPLRGSFCLPRTPQTDLKL